MKRANGSAVLSHLFEQRLVSLLSYRDLRETGERFRHRARDLGRDLPDNREPRRVVFAIHLATGRQLGPNTLFPFAQASLAGAAAQLRDNGIHVEVVGIDSASASEAA